MSMLVPETLGGSTLESMNQKLAASNEGAKEGLRVEYSSKSHVEVQTRGRNKPLERQVIKAASSDIPPSSLNRQSVMLESSSRRLERPLLEENGVNTDQVSPIETS